MATLYVIGDQVFLPGLLALLYSVRVNDPGLRHLVVLHHDHLSPLGASAMRPIQQLWANVEFLNCSELYPWAWSLPQRGALISLLKYEVFRHNGGSHALYLDTDMLVLGQPSSCLRQLEAARAGLCAVENRSRADDFRLYAATTFPINAGFFAIDRSSFPESRDLYETIQREVTAAVPELSNKPTMVCQPIINRALASCGLSYVAAPERFNFRDLKHFHQCRSSVVNLHFVTRSTNTLKPWEVARLGNGGGTSEALELWSSYHKAALTVR